MVVLAIALVALLQYKTSVVLAKEATLKSQLFVLRDALDQYQADRGTCPASLSQLESDKYIRAVPVDPFTKSSTTWQYTQASTSQRAACDVKTTSPKVARNGSRYTDW
jgi:general secretion pathway protein G